MQDHPDPSAVLQYQMAARMHERNLPSGSRSVVLTPAQLDDLALKYQGDDSPLGRGLRLLLDLDERLEVANPQVSGLA
ncbi:hypothetical protein [Streptomyces sp. Midd1]|uniref:hypothetical protein n=1 Tax=Streptomyces sp. Midd3 TaxID=3161191 RepID=UPI0034DAD7C7